MAGQQDSAADMKVAGVATVAAHRIGIIGDNHSSEDDGSDLPDEVLHAFHDVDLIVHLGHTGVRERLARGVLDRLEKVAPVLAVRDYSSDKDGNIFLSPPEGDRVVGVTRVIDAGGFRIGAIHNLGKEPGPEIAAPPGGVPELEVDDLRNILSQKFGGPVDVVAFAGTHRAVAISTEGVLFVNPGSPTYPKGAREGRRRADARHGRDLGCAWQFRGLRGHRAAQPDRHRIRGLGVKICMVVSATVGWSD